MGCTELIAQANGKRSVVSPAALERQDMPMRRRGGPIKLQIPTSLYSAEVAQNVGIAQTYHHMYRHAETDIGAHNCSSETQMHRAWLHMHRVSNRPPLTCHRVNVVYVHTTTTLTDRQRTSTGQNIHLFH